MISESKSSCNTQHHGTCTIHASKMAWYDSQMSSCDIFQLTSLILLLHIITKLNIRFLIWYCDFSKDFRLVWNMTHVCIVSRYTKPKGQLPDYTSPVVLKANHTSVEDFCLKIHKSLLRDFKQWVQVSGSKIILRKCYKLISSSSSEHKPIVRILFASALVWGSSVKHQPQRVGKDHRLNDEDVVQIIKK